MEEDNSSFSAELSEKKSFFAEKILRLLVHTFTVDIEHSRDDRLNLMVLLQM